MRECKRKQVDVVQKHTPLDLELRDRHAFLSGGCTLLELVMGTETRATGNSPFFDQFITKKHLPIDLWKLVVPVKYLTCLLLSLAFWPAQGRALHSQTAFP